MFAECKALYEINKLEKLINDKVINISHIFYDCSSSNELVTNK